MARKNPLFSSPPSQARRHRYRRPSAPGINIPVHDGYRRPSAPRINIPPRARAPALDPGAAAVKIQSCFRGFAVRRRKPLQNLRAIAAVLSQLHNLHSEMQANGFLERIKSNTKERLRFTESIMALLLQLDAIEGSLPEVRMRRKEATKTAVGLQDAVDDMLQDSSGGTGKETVADNGEKVNPSLKACSDTHCTSTPPIPSLSAADVVCTAQSTDYDVGVAEDTQLKNVDHVEATDITDGDEASSRLKGAAEIFESAPFSNCGDEDGTVSSNGCSHGIEDDGRLLDASNHQHCSDSSFARDPEGESRVADEHYEHSDCALGREQERCPELLLREPDAYLEDLCGASNMAEGGLESNVRTGSKVPHLSEDWPNKEQEKQMVVASCGVPGEKESERALASCVPEEKESERALLDKLFDECKHLKSLLSQLCIQQQLQNESIAVLSNRTARLEQAGQCTTNQEKEKKKRQMQSRRQKYADAEGAA